MQNSLNIHLFLNYAFIFTTNFFCAFSVKQIIDIYFFTPNELHTLKKNMKMHTNPDYIHNIRWTAEIWKAC